MALRRVGLPTNPETGRPQAAWPVTDRSRSAVKPAMISATFSKPNVCPEGKCLRSAGHDGEHWPSGGTG